MRSSSVPQFETPSFVKKHPANPLLKADMVPYPSVLTFNAGITKYNGKYVMVFRNDYDISPETIYQKSGEINLGLATSDDGINWSVAPKPCWSMKTDEIWRIYDPRLTVIEGKCYVCFAMDTNHGLRGGVAVTEDFDKFEILSLSAPDNRNMVLFPEKINGRFMRLERPLPVYSRGANRKESFDLWCSFSPECRYWGDTALVLGAEQVPYANSKIGPGAPPIKTKEGWLCTIHAVHKVDSDLPCWHRDWRKVYMGGLMLLDLEDPTKIISLAQKPLLVPEEQYETHGYRGSVIFPGGMILEDTGEVKIYYGSADTVECLATADVDDLIKFAKNEY
ncbi:MAG: glycoside hydrolase family 130 protein [Victivallales bacterium]|nr:glycoside hydrolase family 130 protein [Victivallales bacterium]